MEKDFSAIKIITKNVRIALPLAYVSNEISGISDILETWKRHYISQLGGILVNYKNVSLTSNSGFIVIEKPVVYYNVRADFELFSPILGNILNGKINRVSREHIGCLIHNTINASIDRRFQTSNDISHLIKLDHEILFQITSFSVRRKVIRIKGIINDECVKLMKELPSFDIQNDVESVISTADLIEGTVDVDWQAENIETINSSIEENNSQSLLSSTYSYLSKPNLSIHNDNENLLNNEKSVIEASLNHKQSYVNIQENGSVSSTSLPSTVGEGDSPSNVIRSPTKQASALKKKKKKSNKGTCQSEYNQLHSSSIESFKMNHDDKKLKKSEDVLLNDTLISTQEIRSVSSNSLTSTAQESDSSFNVITSPSKRVSSLKKKKSKKDKAKSMYHLESPCIETSDVKHTHKKKLKQKPEHVSVSDSLIDFKVPKDVKKKKKKSTTKSNILSKTECNNLNTRDANISLPKIKTSTKKLYNEHLHEQFNRLPDGQLSSSQSPKKVLTDKGIDLVISTFSTLLDSKDIVNSIKQDTDKGEEDIKESFESEMKELLDSTKVKQETSEICKNTNELKHSRKIEKKRKRKSSDNSGSPKKKKKTEADFVSNKHKLHKEKKSKKKHKEKSKKDSKKSNKLKSIDDLLKSRKRLLKESSKNKKKKLEKGQKKKSGKSKKSKKVPK